MMMRMMMMGCCIESMVWGSGCEGGSVCLALVDGWIDGWIGWGARGLGGRGFLRERGGEREGGWWSDGDG